MFGVRIIKMQSRYVVGDGVVVFRDFSVFSFVSKSRQHREN